METLDQAAPAAQTRRLIDDTRAEIDKYEQSLAGLDARVGVPGTEASFRIAVALLRQMLAGAECMLALTPEAASAFSTGLSIGRLDSSVRIGCERLAAGSAS